MAGLPRYSHMLYQVTLLSWVEARARGWSLPPVDFLVCVPPLIISTTVGLVLNARFNNCEGGISDYIANLINAFWCERLATPLNYCIGVTSASTWQMDGLFR